MFYYSYSVASTLSKLTSIKQRPSVLKEIIDDRIHRKKYRKEIDNFVANLRMKSLTSHPNKLGLNKLCCFEDWENEELKQTIFELEKFGAVGGPRRHRKDWEWALGIIAMKKLGKLNKSSQALGIGSGKEAILFYLTNQIDHLFATDLYEGGSWTEAPSDFPENPKKYCPSDYNEKALTVLRMNGTKIEFPSEKFDIVFSFSSIEHFGGINHSGARKSLSEIERVLKTEGIAVISTEFIINGKDHNEFFNCSTIYSDFLSQVKQLQLVEPLDLHVTPRTFDTILDYFTTGLNWHKQSNNYKDTHPHILLRRRDLLWTSVMLVLKKGSVYR